MAEPKEPQEAVKPGDASSTGGNPQTSSARSGEPAATVETEPASEAGVASGSSLEMVLDVPLRLTVEIGGTELYVREVLQLDKGSVVELDRTNGEPADVLVNGRVVGRGEVTVVDDRLAVRIVELAGMDRAMRTRR